LHGTQVLELIDQEIIPARAQLCCRGGIRPEQLFGQDNQVIEVSQIPGSKALLIPSEELTAPLAQWASLQPVEAKKGQDLGATLLGNPESLQDAQLIIMIGDPEPGTETTPPGKVPQNLEAEGVQGATGDVLAITTAGFTQSGSDLLGCLVGEGDRKYSPRRYVQAGDEMLDPTDQTIGLSRSGSGQHQERA
jgi:hypothetical protein